jgi:hypothetical protein
MPGGLLQLVAYGAQDAYLTGSPKKTFWKYDYSKYTNFAMESIQQDVAGTVGFGSYASIVLGRYGDLVQNVAFEVTLMRGLSGPNDPIPYYPAEHLFEKIEFLIGGQVIDTIHHEWFRLYWEMYLSLDQETAYRNMADFGAEQQGWTRTFYIPVPFFFSQFERGLALPLIALQYHEVELKVYFTSAADFANQGVDTTFTPIVKCYANYVFLDTKERQKFASKSHMYLISQIQRNTFNVNISSTKINRFKYDLNFNHPVKTIQWAFTPSLTGSHGQYTAKTGEQDNEVYSVLYDATLLLNGQERFSKRKGSYFTRLDQWNGFNGSFSSAGIYCYSFGTQNQEYQPSGTLNFSRIDNASLSLTTKVANVADINATGQVTDEMCFNGSNVLQVCQVFAYGYNWLKIQSGLGGLLFAN